MVSRKPSLDYYEILGLPRDASQGDIGAAFRSRVLAIRDQPGAGEETRRINLAYRALSDPDRRADYDEALTRPIEPLAFADPEDSVPPPPPPVAEPFAYADDDDAQPERSGKGRARMVAAAIVILLLLFAGAWASGLLRGDPEIASTTGSGAEGNSGAGANGDPAPERDGNGGLGDVLAALTGRDESTDPPEPLAPPVEIATAPQGESTVRTIVSDSGARSAADAADDVETPQADEPAERTVGTEPEPLPAAQEELSGQASEPEPRAPPPPAPVDRSSGPRLIRGGLYDSDNRGGRLQGTVGVQVAVGTDGRPQGCRVVRSSGNQGLDITTCQLLQQRLVFSPARDRSGAPVRTVVESTHVWGVRRRR